MVSELKFSTSLGFCPNVSEISTADVVDACSGVECELFGKCQVKNGKPKCVCPLAENCSPSGAPVCATNGKSYDNECLMKVDSCTKRRGIFVVSNGTCSKCI